MRQVAISQSNYIPWKGYFDLIASVDVFVLYDDMQYTKRDWRNRNKIKTPNGLKWLTIPVEVKGKYNQKINETLVADAKWAQSHWSQLQQNYVGAAYFKEIADWLKPLYLNSEFTHLADWNLCFIGAICQFLGIDTQIIDSREFTLVDGKSERLADLCEQLGATEYISGPAAKDYIDEDVFSARNITVSWADYSNYPLYTQLNGDFEHSVTILDLLFNHGVQAKEYMKYCK